MAYKTGYKDARGIWDNKKGCFEKDLVIKGNLSIEDIKAYKDMNGTSMIDKYNLHIGEITPFTNLLIVK